MRKKRFCLPSSHSCLSSLHAACFLWLLPVAMKGEIVVSNAVENCQNGTGTFTNVVFCDMPDATSQIQKVFVSTAGWEVRAFGAAKPLPGTFPGRTQ